MQGKYGSYGVEKSDLCYRFFPSAKYERRPFNNIRRWFTFANGWIAWLFTMQVCQIRQRFPHVFNKNAAAVSGEFFFFALYCLPPFQPVVHYLEKSFQLIFPTSKEPILLFPWPRHKLNFF